MATETSNRAFVDSLFEEIVHPAAEELLAGPYFTDLRNGTLTKRRMQGFSLQHTWFNRALLKGGAIRMLRAVGDEAFMSALRGVDAEMTHPDLCKKFGLSLGLTEEDFAKEIPLPEVVFHTSVIVAGPLLFSSPAVGRAGQKSDETIVQRSREDHVQYDRWAREGWIRKTEGSATDYGEVRKEIHRLATKYDVQEIAVDPWNAQDLNGRLISDGFDVIQVPQTARHVSHPAKELEKLVAEGRLRHGENPVLTWCASNATVRSDSNENIKPDKKRSKEKIDGIVAVVNGLARALVRPKRTKWLLSQGDAS